MTQTPYEPERFRSSAYLEILDDQPSTLTLSIAPSAVTQLQQASEAGYPHEVCGLLIGNFDYSQGWQIHEVREVANLNTERAADRFQLDPQAYQQIDKSLRGSGREIIGVYHSHPDCPAKPSPTDIENAWDGFAYPIISVCDGNVAEIRCWSMNDQGNRFAEIVITGYADA